jgi:hypothetical protein
MIPTLLLLAYSVWVQLSGVALWWGEYPQHLPPESAEFLEWGGGLNLVQYLRWVIIPQIWAVRPLDNAWVEVDALLIPALLGGLVIVCGVWVWKAIRSIEGVGAQHAVPLQSTEFASPEVESALAEVVPPEKGLKTTLKAYSERFQATGGFGWVVVAYAGLVLIYLLITWAGLRVLYERDERYLALDESLHAMLPIVETDTTSDDVILLSTPGYEPFFLNYYKNFGSGRVITLPLQPGEQFSPEQPPLVRSDYPDALLTKETIPLIHSLASSRERLWLLVQFGPDLGWSTRPAEWFMTSHYYPIRYQETSSQTRLVEYSTVSAPDMFAFRSPEILSDLVYDGTIPLTGFDLPVGTEYTAGMALPVSLYWQTNAPLEANYSVALFLRAADGSPVAQSDWQPAGYFAPTSSWRVGVPLWDNRGLHLPPELPEGEYQLWVKVYDNPDGTPADLPVTGAETLEGSIGVLPVRITVRNA